MQNGDFSERDADGIPIGWGCSEGAWQTVIRPAEEGVILSRETGGNNLSVSQRVMQLLPGAEYEVSAMVRSQNVSGSAISVKMEYWKGIPGKPSRGDFLGDTQGAFFPNTNGEWKKMSQKFSVPAECEYVSIMFRLYGRGTVQYKDASLVKTKDPVILRLETDAVFYYTGEEENGTATLAKTEFYHISDENKKVLFSLCDTSGMVLKQETVPFTGDRGASFSYPVELIQKKKTAYVVRAEFQDGDKTLYTLSQNVYKYDRPSNIDNRGQIKDANGSPFHPVLAYHCRETDLAEAAKAGVNLAQGYWGGVTPLEYLDIAQRYGIQVMVSLYPNLKPAAHPDSRAYAVNLIETLKDHPALFGWMIMDEPYYNLYEPEKILEESYVLIREYDETHPIYILECETEHFADAAKFGDVFGIDPYIGDNALRNTVYDMTGKAEEAVMGKKPVISVLQTFSYEGYFPTAEDVQHMLCQAVFAGAEGVGYYCFEKADGTNSLTKTALWEPLVEMTQNLYPNLFAVLSDGIYDGMAEQRTEGNVLYKVWNRDGRYGMFAINQSDVAQTITVSGFYDTIQSTYGNGTVSCSSGTLSVFLPAEGTVVIHSDIPITQLPPIQEGYESDISAKPEEGAPVGVIFKDLMPCETYTVSLYVKSDADGAAAIHTAFMHEENEMVSRLATYEKQSRKEINDTDSISSLYGGTDGYRKTYGEWEKLTYNITLPENANAVKIMLMNRDENAVVCYKNFKIEKARNLISNGTFEGAEVLYTAMATHFAIESGTRTMAEQYGTPVPAEENGGLAEGNVLELTMEDSDWARMRVPVINGETYYFSVDYKAVSSSADPVLQMHYTNGTKECFVTGTLPAEENAWKRFETLFTVEDGGAKGSLTEVYIGLSEGCGTIALDNLTLEKKGVRFYDGVRRLEDAYIKSGLVTIAMDYIPDGKTDDGLFMAAAYFADAETAEIADVEIIRIPADADFPVVLKGTLNLPRRKNEKGYALRGILWK